MIELTLEQQESIAREEEKPVRAVDPSTRTRYVLVPEDVYFRISRLFTADDDLFVQDLTPHVMEVFGRAGWDDPAMDVYNELCRRESLKREREDWA